MDVKSKRRLLADACQTGNLEQVKLCLLDKPKLVINSYLENPAIPSTTGPCTSLMLASFFGHAPIVTLLLEKGALINMKTHDHGLTALMFACGELRVDVVRVLLKHHEVDVDAYNSKGENSLLYMYSRMQATETPVKKPAMQDVFLTLLAGGIDVRHTDRKGYTALHRAVSLDLVTHCQQLIDAGAEIDAALLTHPRQTPLMQLSHHHQSTTPSETIRQLLIQNGASIDDVPQMLTATTMNHQSKRQREVYSAEDGSPCQKKQTPLFQSVDPNIG